MEVKAHLADCNGTKPPTRRRRKQSRKDGPKKIILKKTKNGKAASNVNIKSPV